jgi:hypothetical protein
MKNKEMIIAVILSGFMLVQGCAGYLVYDRTSAERPAIERSKCDNFLSVDYENYKYVVKNWDDEYAGDLEAELRAYPASRKMFDDAKSSADTSRILGVSSVALILAGLGIFAATLANSGGSNTGGGIAAGAIGALAGIAAVPFSASYDNNARRKYIDSVYIRNISGNEEYYKKLLDDKCPDYYLPVYDSAQLFNGAIVFGYYSAKDYSLDSDEMKKIFGEFDGTGEELEYYKKEYRESYIAAQMSPVFAGVSFLTATDLPEMEAKQRKAYFKLVNKYDRECFCR